MTVAPQAVLDFWIGKTAASTETLDEKFKLWFQKSFETDKAIADRFLPTLTELASGLASDWAARGAHDRLAAIIVLDQFSRNIFRDHPYAFRHDALALDLAKAGIAEGEDQGLAETERIFFYLPYEHSEDIADQEMSIQLFEKLCEDARPDFRGFCDTTLDYAHQHKRVIERFGRFPHRNAVLRRTSTRPEEEYLSQPGAGF